MAEFNPAVNNGPEDGEHHKINCLKCRYFEVTWDPNFPRGCKIFNIKGRNLPSETVKATTGRDCPSFTPKIAR